MKKTVLWSAVLAMFIFGGCSSKDPSIDATDDSAKTSKSGEGAAMVTDVVEEDVIVVDENAGIEDGSERTMGGLESRMQSVNFAFDKFDVAAQESDKITGNAAIVNGDASEFTIKLEGNCDEWGSDEYNFALGLKRANSAKDAMIAEGVDSKRIAMVSYGESNPVCIDKTRECWAKNRRVDFKLLP